MNLINNNDYSCLKSRVNLLKMISDLYKNDNTDENIIIDFTQDYKEQILSNVKETTDAKILANTLFYIFIHEIEIKETTSDFEEIKKYIWDKLGKYNTLETFEVIINHLKFIYNTYPFNFDLSRFFEYIEKIEDFSLIEDKILESIPFNSKSLNFYIDLNTYFLDSSNHFKITSLLSKMKCSVFEDISFNEFSCHDSEVLTLSETFLLFKMYAFSYYQELNQRTKFDNVYLSTKHLNFLLFTYINDKDNKSEHIFDDKDYLKIFYYLNNYPLYDFIKKQLHLLYIEEDTIKLIRRVRTDQKIKSDFLKKTSKIKELININQSINFDNKFIDFLISNFSINYWILFINDSNANLINSNTIYLSKDFSQGISNEKLRDESLKSIDFLLNDNINKKIEQFIIFQNMPFNYEILFSDFIGIWADLNHFEKKPEAMEYKNTIINSQKYYQDKSIDMEVKYIYSLKDIDIIEKNTKMVDFIKLRKFNKDALIYTFSSIYIFHYQNRLSFEKEHKEDLIFKTITMMEENKEYSKILNTHPNLRNNLINAIIGIMNIEDNNIFYKHNNITDLNNDEIDNFINNVYTSNENQQDRNRIIGNFCATLNIKQFESCMTGLFLYHKNNNLNFEINDRKLITLDILFILSELNNDNLDLYRNILIKNILNKSINKEEQLIKKDSNLDCLEDKNSNVEQLDFKDEVEDEDEDNENYIEEDLKKVKEIDQMIISIYENSKLNTKDKALFFAKAIKNMDIASFTNAVNSLRLYHLNNNTPFTLDDKKAISYLIVEELSDVIKDEKVHNEYRESLIDNITGYIEIKDKEKNSKNKQDTPIPLFSEDDTQNELRTVDDNGFSEVEVMEIINQLEQEVKDDDSEKNYFKEEETKKDAVLTETLYEIFSAESETEIENCVDDLGDEGKVVKNQLRKIRKKSNKRKLQSSSKFFENVDKLRNNFPNFEEFITAIEDYSILNQLGDNHFYIPPSLLVGDPGIGKTFFLSELSDLIGIENKMIHMETISASWLLVGSSPQWKDAKPGIIYDNIMNSKYANNIFILDELDKMMKSNYPVDNCLLQLFEKHTAKEFRDEYIPLKLDISKIIWLATANTLSTISDPILSRLQTYKIANPNFNERKKLAQNIYNHMLAENTWGNHFNPVIPDATLDKLCEPSDSIREMKKTLLKAITHSARRKDNVITLEDVISVNTTSKNKIGFM